MAKIDQALQEGWNLWRRITGCVGVATGHKETAGADTGGDAVVFFVREKLPLALVRRPVPLRVGGVQTDVVATGRIEALRETNVAPTVRSVNTKRMRPAQCGCSIGHPKVTAGTLGAIVACKGTPYSLSNCHVIANSGDASIGDPIIQPGRYDGGNVTRDVIGHLQRWAPIKYNARVSWLSWLWRWFGHVNPENEVDAAIAAMRTGHAVGLIVGQGPQPREICTPCIGMGVQKVGRTTGHTRGRIKYLRATIDVGYGGGRIATFRNQIVSNVPSAGGDSGSHVYTTDRPTRSVGLLFAGGRDTTIINPMARVCELLRVSFP